MIRTERVKRLTDEPGGQGDYVLYWMQASQRVESNPALEFAIRKANEEGIPLVVYFGVTNDFPEANLRHYAFMIEGLKEVNEKLDQRGIKFLVRQTNPPDGAIDLAREASLVVVDRGYLRIQKRWRNKVAAKIDVPLYQIEGDVVVPVEVASDKEEYAARTIRPKITEKIEKFSGPTETVALDNPSKKLDLAGKELDDILESLEIDRSVKPSPVFSGGASEAKKLLEEFVENKLDDYDEFSSDPSKDYLSHMSPYLHFGQISPVYILNRVKRTNSPGLKSYLEQLVVRRELSMNFVHHNEDYDDLSKILPDWAKETLQNHSSDAREYEYSREEFEKGETHDPYWNAAQKEMVLTGKTHGYMRMYWGKKILEWTPDPGTGYEISLYLNNKYELDGRDPNGFTGVAWCYGKHDQAWKERKIFGKVRYMNANGLERKFDISKYVERIDRLESERRDN